MEPLTTPAKISFSVKEAIKNNEAKFIEQLDKGDLYSFGESLRQMFQSLHNLAAESYMRALAKRSEAAQRAKAVRKRLCKLVKRPVKIQLMTGHYVELEGLCAKKAPSQHKGPRHLLHLHWNVLKGASPCCFSQVMPLFRVVPILRGGGPSP